MVYNYKSDNTVQDVVVECLCPIMLDIQDTYSTLRRNEFILVYAPSCIAREIYTRILDEVDDVWVDRDSNIRLLATDDNDVIITLATDGMVYVEEARGDDKQLKTPDGSTLAYVYDGYTSKDIDRLSEDGDSILVFGFEEEEIEDELDDDVHGFTVSKSDENGYSSYSFYSDNIELVEYMARLFR